MFYLLFQMFLYMLVALLLGLWLGWMLSRRGYLDEIMRMVGLQTEEPAAAMPGGDLEVAYRRLQSDNTRITDELARANSERNTLQNDLEACIAARDASSKSGGGSSSSASVASAAAAVVTAPKAAVAAATTVDVGTKPEGISGPRGGKADDLKEIKGIGPKLEKMLHGMGFYHFDQIAGWGSEELAWVDENLEGFKGRASRDEWIRQAKKLA